MDKSLIYSSDDPLWYDRGHSDRPFGAFWRRASQVSGGLVTILAAGLAAWTLLSHVN